jgi:hypothetical protein
VWLHLQLTSLVKIVSLIHAQIVLSLLEHLSNVRWLGSQLPFLGLTNVHPALAEQQWVSRTIIFHIDDVMSHEELRHLNREAPNGVANGHLSALFRSGQLLAQLLMVPKQFDWSK